MFRRIIGLGLCVVDHLYLVEDLDDGATRTRFTERCVASGGMTGTALAQAATLGCNTHVLTALGDDADGRRVRSALRAAGVKTQRILHSAATPTTVAVVLVDRRTGGRRFVVPDRRGIESASPDFDLSLIDRGTLLLVDGHFPAQALRAVRRAREVGATVVGDFHRPRPEVRRLLPLVDHPIVSEEYVEASGDADPRATLRGLAERCRDRPVVTLGSRGGLYLEGRRVRRYRALRTRVLDSTGAGDVFHGAFAAGLYHGLEFADALDLAARAPAQCCTALGGTGRLLTPAEMRAATGRKRTQTGPRRVRRGSEPRSRAAGRPRSRRRGR